MNLDHVARGHSKDTSDHSGQLDWVVYGNLYEKLWLLCLLHAGVLCGPCAGH